MSVIIWEERSMSVFGNKLGIKSSFVLMALQAMFVMVVGIALLSTNLQTQFRNLQSSHQLPVEILQHGQFDASLLVDADFLSRLMGETLREALVLNNQGGVIVATGVPEVLRESKRNTTDLVRRVEAGLVPAFKMARAPNGEWTAESVHSLTTPLGDNVYLMVNSGTQNYQAAKQRLIYQISLGGLACILLLPLFHYFIFVRGFGRRVSAFLEVVRSAAAGSQGERVVLPDSPDEFSELQLEFNYLLAELDQSRSQLTTHTSLLYSSREKLSRLQAQWRALTEWGDQTVFTLDLDGKILESNHPFSKAGDPTLNADTLYERANQSEWVSQFKSAVNNAAVCEWKHKGFSQDHYTQYVSKLAPIFAQQKICGALLQVRVADAQPAMQPDRVKSELLLSNVSEGLLLWDLKLDRIEYSRQWCEMIGLTRDEIESTPDDWFSRVHPEDIDALKEELEVQLSHYQKPLLHEYRMRHDLGGWRVMRLTGRTHWNDKGEVQYFSAAQEDITERRQANTFNTQLYDVLTGLPNLTLFKHHLERALAKQKRGDYRYSVLMIQIREFENIQDTLGEAISDQLLASVARHLKAELRPGDLLAGFERGRFAILLDGVDARLVVNKVATRIAKRLARNHKLSDTDVFIRINISGLLGLFEFETANKLLHQLEYNLNQSVRLKKILIQDPSKLDHSQIPVMIQAAEMKEALRVQEITLKYQPVVSMHTRELCGFEALARWQHPHQGELMPTQFLHKFETSEMMPDLFDAVFAQVCEQVPKWQSSAGERVWTSINLSRSQLMSTSLLQSIDRILTATGADPRLIVFEVTEETLRRALPESVQVVNQLKARHIKIQLDDFGTSDTSLQILNRFPIDKVKIDSRLVRIHSRHENGEAQEYLNALVAMAHSLQIEVIAEGVEDAAMLYGIQPLDCDYAQGFCFSPPLECQSAKALIGEVVFG